ncbi:hypothetical protein CYMTET_51922 [Cymbomonas tetramitiformis]|uniref:Glycosyl transferase family 1 domain-containing protein n=1 Tax=Cymbomonas tetramitiformis TaxID=36881 RepID=A0AAE0ES58_9CHLO|nr:hypothetical protein CYMTET_51922 [Cymbomonas tetramitiformis]
MENGSGHVFHRQLFVFFGLVLTVWNTQSVSDTDARSNEISNRILFTDGSNTHLSSVNENIGLHEANPRSADTSDSSKASPAISGVVSVLGVNESEQDVAYHISSFFTQVPRAVVKEIEGFVVIIPPGLSSNLSSVKLCATQNEELCDSKVFIVRASEDGYLNAVKAGLALFSKPGLIVLTAPAVRFNPSALSALQRADPRSAAAAIAITEAGTVLAAGYDLFLTPFGGVDVVLPSAHLEGYPVEHHAVASVTEMIAAPALCVTVQLEALRSVANLVDMEVKEFSGVLALEHTDLFLRLRQQGTYLTLVPGSRVKLSREGSKRLSTPMGPAVFSAVGAFKQKWGSELAKPYELQIHVNWMMHCAGSMGVEALNYVSVLEGRLPLRTQVVRPVPACEHMDTISSLPTSLYKAYDRLRSLSAPAGEDAGEVLVYHKDYRSLHEDVPVEFPAKYLIGRYMVEGNGTLHQGLIEQCQRLDEVWVPSRFHVEVFSSNGVPRSKLFVVPEISDGELWQNSKGQPFPLPDTQKHYVFLSVFKLEDRKGWHELVEGYCRAFASDADTMLLLHIHQPADSMGAPPMQELIAEHLDFVGCRGRATRPRIEIITQDLTFDEMVYMYRRADCYVSAHWGEGWGLPIADAMALGLPTIATNFSGNTEFMTGRNSYLVPASRMEPYPQSDAWFFGLEHAVPNVTALAHTFRLVHQDRAGAVARGKQASHDMRTWFSPKAVSGLLMGHFARIQSKLANGHQGPPVAAHPALALAAPRFLEAKVSHWCAENWIPAGPQLWNRLKPMTNDVLVISTYPPKECGIAQFSQNLVRALQRNSNIRNVDVVALAGGHTDVQYSGMPEVKMVADMSDISGIQSLANFANNHRYGLVIMQHEFGIYGPEGTNGDLAVCLASSLQLPTAIVYHTVVPSLSDGQRQILKRLHEVATWNVVMSPLSNNLMDTQLMLPSNVVIEHGAPLVQETASVRSLHRAAWGWTGRRVMLSNGLLHKGKGFEAVVGAMPHIKDASSRVLYVIVGCMHEREGVSAGETTYSQELMQQAKKMGLAVELATGQAPLANPLTDVLLVPYFVQQDALLEMLHAADVFLAPYKGNSISSSGTVTMAMAAGVAVVATPFQYSSWALRSGQGVLLDHSPASSEAVSAAVIPLLANGTLRQSYAQSGQSFIRKFTWNNISNRYASLLHEHSGQYLFQPRSMSRRRSTAEKSFPTSAVLVVKGYNLKGIIMGEEVFGGAREEAAITSDQSAAPAASEPVDPEDGVKPNFQLWSHMPHQKQNSGTAAPLSRTTSASQSQPNTPRKSPNLNPLYKSEENEELL